MHFLIVNDDGINSPFLPILTQAVKRAGHRVTVCVPATQQSAKAHAFSIEQPILAEKREVPDADEAWAIFGTPVDSCRIGAMNLAPDADAVISGINLGYNVGMSVYVSGTVGAAREATFLHKPGIAVSAEKQTPGRCLRPDPACHSFQGGASRILHLQQPDLYAGGPARGRGRQLRVAQRLRPSAPRCPAKLRRGWCRGMAH